MEPIQLPKVKKRRFKRFLPLLLVIMAAVGGYYAVQFIITRQTTVKRPGAKQLLKQLVNDLQTDTANLQKAIAFDSKLLSKNDSLLMMLQGPVIKTDSGKIRQLILSGYFSRVFQSASKGREAIKGWYHLKGVAGTKIPEYIADYENSLDTIGSLAELQSIDLDADIRSFFNAHFASAKGRAATGHGAPATSISNIATDDMDKFNAAISVIQDCNSNLILNSERARQKAVRLIDYVKKLR